MARIRPYESQVSSQGDLPAQRAGEGNFGGPGLIHVGQAVEDLGASAGQVQRFMLEQKGRQEVTDAHVEHAELNALLADEADARGKTWKSGDPPVSEQMSGILKNRLDSFMGGEEGARFETAQGVNTARGLAAQTSQHVMGVARQMDAKLAGEAAVNQSRAFNDSLANFAYGHPAHTNLLLGQAEQNYRNPNGLYAASKIGQQVQDKLLRDSQEQIAVQAVKGMTKLFPNRALQVLQQAPEDRDEQYAYMQSLIPNEKMQELVGHAEQAVHAQGVEERMARAEERQRLKDLSDTIETSLMEKHGLHQGDPKQPALKAMDVVDAMEKGLDGTTGRTILNMLDSDAKGRTAKTDDRTLWNLFRRIHLPYGDPEKLTSTDAIYKAATAHLLEPSKMNFLRTEFVNSQTDEGQKIGETRANFLKGQEHNITKANPLLGKLDPEGDEKLSKFIYFARAEEDRFRKENKDPGSLYNPDSPDYLGKQVSRFQIPLMESIGKFGKKLQKAPTTTAPETGGTPTDTHRLPNETPKQYLDRMKK